LCTTQLRIVRVKLMLLAQQTRWRVLLRDDMVLGSIATGFRKQWMEIYIQRSRSKLAATVATVANRSGLKLMRILLQVRLVQRSGRHECTLVRGT